MVFVQLGLLGVAMIPPSVVWIRCLFEERLFRKERSLAGKSAVAPLPGTACCSRDGTGDNAFALSSGNSSRGR